MIIFISNDPITFPFHSGQFMPEFWQLESWGIDV